MSLLIDLPDLGVKLKLNAGELNVTVPNPDRKDEYKLTGNLKIGKVVTSGLSMTGMSVQDLTLSDLRFDEKNIADLVLAYTGRELTLKSCVYRNNTPGRGDGLPPHNPAIFDRETLQKLLIIDCDLQEIVIGEHSGITQVNILNSKRPTDQSYEYNRKSRTFHAKTYVLLAKTLDILVLENAILTGNDARPRPHNMNNGEFPVDNLLAKCSEFSNGYQTKFDIGVNKFLFSNYSLTHRPCYYGQANPYLAHVISPSGLLIGTVFETITTVETRWNTPRSSNNYDYVGTFAWYQSMVCTGTLNIPAICRMIGLTPEVAEIVNRLSA